MPVKITKLKNGMYRVSTPSGVKAKSTTKKNAEAQKRILEQADRGEQTRRKKRILRPLKS